MAATPGTAVVSGALSIIGIAYAEYLSTCGYDLLLIDQHRRRLNRLAETLTTLTRRAVEVVVVNRRSSVDLATVVAQIEQDASIAIVVNISNRQGYTLLSDGQAKAMVDGSWSEREISCTAIRKFLSKRGVVSTYRAEVFITAAGHVAELPALI
jgi:short-subunit dehydrogenase